MAEKFKKAWETIKAIWSVVVSFFKGIWTGIKTAFSNVISFYQGIFSGAFTAIKNAFSGFVEFFQGLWRGVKNAFSNVKTWLSNAFDVFGAIKKKFEGWKTYFSNRWKDITNVFGDAKNYLINKFNVFGAIKKKFEGWKTYWDGLWGDLKEGFKGIGTKIGNAMSGAVKTALNKVIGSVETIINKAIRFINSAIRLANKLPGVNVSTLSEIKLNRLAQGGVLAKGQVGLLEGSGAEAVVPLEKNTQWIGKVADSFKAEFASMARQYRADNVPQQMKYDEAVDAFKEALSEMQIVLDDETAGKFIEKTVTRYVYA